ncbi:hypothetical protein CCR75_001286 [Bremia lactucae]|uniref:Nucleolar protein 14 n=1 Tax=Bremia lactucae TaxID=4779 RepID=A0A976IFI2_BRELC|nr:hypothetical protein CCR75_001286 [Bremia lactucae]
MTFKRSSTKKVSTKTQKHGFIRANSSDGKNPFDVRGNASKQKYEVIGRRVKGAGRNVAAARAEAERKRKKTLGAEYKARNRSNVFKDKRLGEQDPTLSIEDKMMARFQTERKRKLRHASAFALHDSESEQEDDQSMFLTHRGAKITEDYDARNHDDEVLDEDDTKESRQLDRNIVHEHHFGGGDTDTKEGASTRKSHKEVMHEVMMKAKFFKAERQKHKSSQDDLTETLDDGFATVRQLLKFRPTRASGHLDVVTEPLDDFDTLTREFAYEAKVKATERRLTPDELAAKERNRLQELEQKRVARMNGIDESDDEKKRGKGKKGKSKPNVRTIQMVPTDDDLMETYTKETLSASEEEDVLATPVDVWIETNEHEVVSKEAMDVDKQDAQEAAAELPYVFECPHSLDELTALFQRHASESYAKRRLILERIVTYFNPRLSVENQLQMKRFFAVLMRYFLTIANHYAEYMHDLDTLAVTLFTLAQQMGDTSALIVREFLSQLYTRLHKRETTSAWPTLPELLLLKSLTAIFPTSDLRHNVVSPMETLLSESLARGTINSPQEATQALFAVSLSLEITQSKARFMPEVITFLTRMLRAFVTIQDEKTTSTHWLRSTLWAYVTTHANEKELTLPRLSLAENTSCAGAEVLSSLLVLIDVASAQYAFLPSFDELFYPLYLLLHALLKQLDNVELDAANAVVSTLHTRLKTCWNTRRPLRLQSFAPTMLPTLDPLYDANYTVRKDKMAPKDTAQLKQLKRQVKRARKGAARELRRDAEFIHREKQKEEETRLAVKEEKQKEIRHWLEEQNATFNQQVRKGGNMLKGGGSARGPAPRARTHKK